MIYGLIPIGGKGKRLGLPFSKEMLPQKGFSFYNPVLDHMVSKMKEAGADLIVFVHGEEYKKDVTEHYKGLNYVHIKQSQPSFAGCLKDFYEHVQPTRDSKILFGLPDSIFEGNLFINALTQPGLVCGLFKTLDSTKVDRLSHASSNGVNEPFFYVKSVRSEDASEWFWGVIKFTGDDIRLMIDDGMFERYTEVGDILNRYPKRLVWGGSYIDLGTWENLNEYWKSTNG